MLTFHDALFANGVGTRGLSAKSSVLAHKCNTPNYDKNLFGGRSSFLLILAFVALFDSGKPAFHRAWLDISPCVIFYRLALHQPFCQLGTG